MVIFIISVDVFDYHTFDANGFNAQQCITNLTREECEEFERKSDASHYDSFDEFVAAFNNGDVSDQSYIKVFND